MADILMRKVLGTLRPVDAQGEEIMRSVSNGSIVRVTVKKPRNIKHHRKYWALISLLHENQERYATPEELSDAIKCATGHCNVLTRSDGYEIRVPRSISFGKMDQTEFDRFYERVIDLAVTRIIPGLSREDIKREVEAMVSDQRGAA